LVQNVRPWSYFFFALLVEQVLGLDLLGFDATPDVPNTGKLCLFN
jgi:hypothetical protein